MACRLTWPLRYWFTTLVVVSLLVWTSPTLSQVPTTTASQPLLEPSASAKDSAPPRSTASASAEPTKPRTAQPALNIGLGPAPDAVRRESPREALVGFLDACRVREFSRAAHYLSLSRIASTQQRRVGPELARQLFEVLENQVWFDLESISDDPTGGLDKAAANKEIQVATIPIKGGTQGIRLLRSTESSGRQVWVFSPSTVESIRDLHRRYGPPSVLESIPSWLKDRPVAGLDLWQWLGLALLLVGCAVLGWVVGKLAGASGRLLLRRRISESGRGFTNSLERPAGWVAGLIVLLMILPSLRLNAAAEQLLVRLTFLGIILTVTYGAIRLINYGASRITAHTAENVGEDLKRRAIATQVTTLRRIAVVFVAVVGIALALMQFPVVRTVGWSLLGSAGIAGAILGFAAQKTFSNIFAGIMISLTQPIRIGDTVVVEKEFGQIEEIGATHVVVKLWDLRRLVLPIVYFLDHPFENWTRTSAEAVGTVRLHADYRVNVEEAREELTRLLKVDSRWDQKTGSLIVEELTPESVVLRATVSAEDSSKLWDLRCAIREQMLAFLQARREQLPTRRVEMASRS